MLENVGSKYIEDEEGTCPGTPRAANTVKGRPSYCPRQVSQLIT